MNPYLHRLLGIYVNRAEAGSAREVLVFGGLPRDQVKLLSPGGVPEPGNSPADSAGRHARAGVGAENQKEKGDVSDLVKQALSKGSFVLVAYTLNEDQTTLAQNLLGESMTSALAVAG